MPLSFRKIQISLDDMTSEIQITVYSIGMFLLITYFCRKLNRNTVLMAIIIAKFNRKTTSGCIFDYSKQFSLGNFMNLNLLKRRIYKSKGDFYLLPTVLPFHQNLMTQCSVITYKVRYFSLVIESWKVI